MVNSTVLTCITPRLPAGTSMVGYVLRLDDVPSPNITIAALMLEVLSDPIVTGFIPDCVPLSTLSSVVSIQVIIYSYSIILATLCPAN